MKKKKREKLTPIILMKIKIIKKPEKKGQRKLKLSVPLIKQ